jgi:transposase
MNTATPRVLRVERVDDLPVLFASLQRLQVAEFLDRHFPTHHLWKGDLSFGDVVCTWLVFLTSQGDHRLYHLLPWVQEHRLTLQACLGKAVRPLDFHDDRLADVLDALAQATPWQDFEADLNGHTVRVYDLDPSLFRIDTTTASSYAQVLSEHGLVQFGHSKDRDDLPQVKIAAAALDPLGLPVTTVTVAGNHADDPLYVPEIQKVPRAFGAGGKTYVGDCKMAALATRAFVASTRDYYLCPLSEKQLSPEERRALLQPVWTGQQPLLPVYRPPALPEHEPERIAEGFSFDVDVQAEIDGKPRLWTERRWLVRSVAFAAGQQQRLEQRVRQAEEQLEQLNVRKQGKKRLGAEELDAAARAILQTQRVEDWLEVRVETTTRERRRRRYGDRPEEIVQEQDHRVEVTRREDALEQARRALGWQVYATNHREMPLAGVVWGYRGQYRIEDDWSRLKGRSLSLTPMYLQDEHRMQGLVLLLSLAVRLLTLLEWQVRKKLQDSGETLRGIYPGQPGRQARRPSAEMLLKVFKGISLSVVEVGGEVSLHVRPLTPVQERLLALWDLPADLFHRLTLHCAQPPPVLSLPTCSTASPCIVLNPLLC